MFRCPPTGNYFSNAQWVADLLGLGEFLPDSILSDIAADLFCDPLILPPHACESVIFILCGYDPDQMNETLLDRIVYHTPAGTSTFTVVQYAQEVDGENPQLLSDLVRMSFRLI